MNAALKARLDEARTRLNSNQAEINDNRKHSDQARREWARGKQRPANADRAELRNSLSDEDREQIEERLEEILRDNPALSATKLQTLDLKTVPPSFSVETFEEYYFLRDMVD